MFTADQLKKFQETNWGRKPQLFRQAIDISQYSLSAEEVCELTGNDLVESRLITPDMTVVHGPFENDGHGENLLPDGSILLIQCLEQHLESVRTLLDKEFAFIPGWQVDDVMASFGDDNANCGAHFDKYDVFLVQHSGRKVWHLDEGGHQESELDPAVDIRLLKSFEPRETFIAEPGDVLYIPPGFGHHGICEDASLTLSVGIRNPTMAELLADLSEFALLSLEDNPTITTRLFSDQRELKGGVMDEVVAAISKSMGPEVLQRWFGSYSTRLREPDLIEPQQAATLTPGAVLEAELPTRLASADHLLFVNGEVFELGDADEIWIRLLVEQRQLIVDESVSSRGIACLETLLNNGALRLKQVHSS